MRSGAEITFDRLRSVAEDRSDAGRDTLLSLLTGLTFQNRYASEHEIAIFADIAARLLPSAQPDVRAAVSAHMADRRGVPKGLVLSLASDLIVVAAPMLRNNPDLGDHDLEDLARTLSDHHRIAIAGREHLNFRITDVLIAHGNILVLRAVAENPGAELSAASAHKLVDQAAEDDELCRILALRNDLPQNDAERLVLLVAKRLRGRMARPAVPAFVSQEPDVPVPPAVIPTLGKPIEIQKLVAEVLHRERSLDEAIVHLALADRYNDIATLLAAVTHIDELSILKVLVRADANGIVNVMRGLEIAPESWAQVVKLRQRRLRFSDVQARYEKEDFAKLSVAKAKQTLAQFSQRHHAG